MRPEAVSKPVLRNSLGYHGYDCYDTYYDESTYYFYYTDYYYGYYENRYNDYYDPYWPQTEYECDEYDECGNKRKTIDEDWACLFNCLTYIDPSHSAKNYYEAYMETGPEEDPARIGGVNPENFNDVFNACGFKATETKAFGGSATNNYIGILNTSEDRSHAVIVLNYITEGLHKDEFIVYDPSKTDEPYYYVNQWWIATFYEIPKE